MMRNAANWHIEKLLELKNKMPIPYRVMWERLFEQALNNFEGSVYTKEECIKLRKYLVNLEEGKITYREFDECVKRCLKEIVTL